MADLFISYAREETQRAEEIRRALEGLGLSVFFDVERLDAGDEWSDVLDRELKSAGAVVALWSPHALSRPWVRKECALAQSRGVLLPALLEPVSDLDMPVQFAGLQRVDLSDFHGAGDHPGWRKLVRALAKTLKRNDLLAAQIEALKEEKQTAKVKAELEAAQGELAKLRKSKGGVKPVFVTAGLVALLLLGGAGAWWGWGEMQRRETEAVKETRASIVDAETMKALAAIPKDEKGNGDQRLLLEAALQKTKLPRLIEASTVDADAALLAGWAYDDGVGGVAKDDAEAVGYYRRSCDLGNLVGCEYLGFNYAQGEGVAEDYAKALSLFNKACTSGNASACSDIGAMYDNGWGVAKDTARAASEYGHACDKGATVGCRNLGVMYENGEGVAQDIPKAISLYGKACDGGEMTGCYGQAHLYAEGIGVARDDAKAVLLYTKACDGKNFTACNNLAAHYEEGWGVAKDHAKVVSLLRIACDGGSTSGCHNLGVKLEEGRGVEKDPASANAVFVKELSLYETFCEDGSATDCWNVGQVFEDGLLGVTKDPAKAATAFGKACKLGNEPSCSKAASGAPPPP